MTIRFWCSWCEKEFIEQTAVRKDGQLTCPVCGMIAYPRLDQDADKHNGTLSTHMIREKSPSQ